MRVVQVVFQTDPDVAAKQQRLRRRRQLGRAGGADIEDTVLGQVVDHHLQDARGIRQRSQKCVDAEHDVDEVRRFVQPISDSATHALDDVFEAEDLSLRLDASGLHHLCQLQGSLGRGRDQDFLAAKACADGLGVKGAHLSAGRLNALDALFEVDFPQPVVELLNHVAVHAAARGVVEDDVAPLTNQCVHLP